MDLFNMTNIHKSNNFIRSLNRGNFIFQAIVFIFSDLLGVWKSAKNVKFQLNI